MATSRETHCAACAAAVTPHDTNEIKISDEYPRAFMCNVAGDVTVDMASGLGTSVVLTCLAGLVYPLQVKRIHSTGTTASGITAFR